MSISGGRKEVLQIFVDFGRQTSIKIQKYLQHDRTKRGKQLHNGMKCISLSNKLIAQRKGNHISQMTTPIWTMAKFRIVKNSIILVMWGTKRKLSMSGIIKTYSHGIFLKKRFALKGNLIPISNLYIYMASRVL